MTTSQATSEAVKLLPGRTIICNERYQSTYHPAGYSTEGLDCLISVHPALVGDHPCQQFRAPSFPACLDQIRAAIQQNETSK